MSSEREAQDVIIAWAQSSAKSRTVGYDPEDDLRKLIATALLAAEARGRAAGEEAMRERCDNICSKELKMAYVVMSDDAYSAVQRIRSEIRDLLPTLPPDRPQEGEREAEPSP